ncbi:hypothetical protein SB758_34040, partial [Burkholderia sp. SIMBA_013]
GEVVAFGQHLGADKDSCTAAMNVSQMLLQRTFAAGGITIDSRHRHAREKCAELLLQLLSPDAYR